jgi:hypothetical protein
MNMTPKVDFRNGPFSKAHIDLVVSPGFQEALRASLLQMVYDEGAPSDPVIAAASWHRIAGARALIHVLMNLAEPPQDKKIEPRTNIWPSK